MEMKCYYVVTRENIVLEYNMQIMCNWMWCIIVEMYPMMVDYVLNIVDYDFTKVDCDFILVEYNFTLWDYIFILVYYKLILVENIISFCRIYTHFSRKYNLI